MLVKGKVRVCNCWQCECLYLGISNRTSSEMRPSTCSEPLWAFFDIGGNLGKKLARFRPCGKRPIESEPEVVILSRTKLQSCKRLWVHLRARLLVFCALGARA